MNVSHYHAFDEVKYTFKIDNRLEVVIIKKPLFHKTFVTLSTPIGAIHRAYKVHDTIKEVPAGIAHFLEHKIFEQDGEDISRLFSLYEADINAYTEHSRTTYLFSATNHLETNIKRLLSMFFFPKFSKDGVEKEKNIIVEELNMHLDNPYHLQFQRLLNNMFSHPYFYDDILGTKESIEGITLDDLKSMHEAYYAPEESVLTIIGDVDPYHLKAVLNDTLLPELPKKTPVTLEGLESDTVVKEMDTIELDILKPSVLFGIKVMKSFDSAQARLDFTLKMSLIMDLLLGKSSQLYETWLETKLINDSYGLEIYLEKDYGYILIGSESDTPLAFKQVLEDVLRNFSTYPIDEAMFNRAKKQMIGSFVMGLDNLDYLAHETNKHAHEGLDIYDTLNKATNITLDDLNQFKKDFNRSHFTTLIVNPLKKA